MSIHYGIPDEDTQSRDPQTQTENTRTASTRTAGTRTASSPWMRTESELPPGGKIEPPAVRGVRPSPALDPLARMRLSALAKWVLLLGVMLFVAWVPLHLHTPAVPNKDVAQTHGYWLSVVTAATIFAAVAATGLPRTLFPSVFGHWAEAVEAFRDWVAVSLTTGLVYNLGISLMGVSGAPAGAVNSQTHDDWLKYRLPLLIVSAVVGVFVSRLLTVRSQGVLSQGKNMPVQVVVQAVLLGALEQPFETGLRALAEIQGAESLVQGGALLCGAVALGILVWAYMADSKLMSLQKGIVSGSGPIELTLTVIGGRQAGKTVLLAAAFYEWTSQNMGNLRISPADMTGGRPDGTDLQKVANDLYVNRSFPVGTLVCQDLPFDLYLGSNKIARFRFLDYPGGAFAGGRMTADVVQEFYARVDDTDGVLMVADMSYVRLGKKDDDWLEVRNAYRTVLQRLIDRNGRNRVVPIALVMTKCDEFVDMNTGRLRMSDMEEGLRFFQYLELEDEWRRLSAQSGPGFAEFTTWFTSAISYSIPRFKNDDPEADFDMTRSFVPVSPPEPIEPTGCAAPLLWLSAKVMRWNVTMFRDLSSFIFGASPAVRQRIDAIVELERVANAKAANVKE